MFRQAALNEDGGALRVEPGGNPVDHHVIHIALDDFAVFIVRGKRMPVGHKEKTLIARLQRNPVFEGAVVVAQVQGASGAHAREHTLAGCGCHRFGC